MIAVQEVTVWKGDIQPNHIYLLDGDKIVAYIPKGSKEPKYLTNKLRMDRRGRKFIELKVNPFKSVKNDNNIVTVKGSKGNTYHVDVENKSCTCSGFQFRGRCKHIDEVLKQ